MKVSVRFAFLLLLTVLMAWSSCQPATGETPASKRANVIYVVNEGEDTVSVIDGSPERVVATIPVGKNPHYVALDPAGKRAYVTNGASHSLSVIDTTTNEVVSTIEGVGKDPQQIVIHPQGKLAYVPCYDSASVYLIDLMAGKIDATIPVGESPQSIAISSDGKRVYVLNLHDPRAMVIDTATNKVAATFAVGEGACGIAVSVNGERLYLGGHGTGMWMGKGAMNMDIRVIDAKAYQQLSYIRCGTMPVAARTSSDGRWVFVTSHGSGELHIIDCSTNKAASVKVGSDCRDVVGSADGRWAYVSNRGDNTVSVVDVAARKVVATVTVGKSPVGIALK